MESKLKELKGNFQYFPYNNSITLFSGEQI